MTAVRDKIHQKSSHSIFRALGEYDPLRSGTLSATDSEAALAEIFGIRADEDRKKIISKLDPEGSGRISIHEFLNTFDHLEPLGNQSDPAIWSPWQDRKGVALTAYNWERNPPSQVSSIGTGYSRGKRESTRPPPASSNNECDESLWRRVAAPPILPAKGNVVSDVRLEAHMLDIDPVLKSLASSDSAREEKALGGKLSRSLDLSATGVALGSSRFYHLRFPDTRHITTPPTSSSNFCSDTWVRKSDPSYRCFQRDDADRRDARQKQSKTRFDWAREREKEIEQANTPEPHLEQKKLAVRGLAKQRYAERSYLYDLCAKREGCSIFFRG